MALYKNRINNIGIGIFENLKDDPINKFFMSIIENCKKRYGEEFCNILFGAEHKSLREAILADIIDTLPIIGDISNFFRVVDAANNPDIAVRRRATAQLIDLMLGALPGPIGTILDIITPTNTIAYLRKEMKR